MQITYGTNYAPECSCSIQVGVALSYALWAVSQNFMLFVLARIIGGLSKGNVSLSTAIVTDVTTAERRSKGMVSTVNVKCNRIGLHNSIVCMMRFCGNGASRRSFYLPPTPHPLPSCKCIWYYVMWYNSPQSGFFLVMVYISWFSPFLRDLTLHKN